MGLFDLVDSIFDPDSGGGFFGNVIQEIGGGFMGGSYGGQPQQTMSYGQPSYAMAGTPVMGSVPAVAARAVAAGLPMWASRFPSLWQALARLKGSGSKMSVDKLLGALRKWGPTALSGMIGAQAVSELITYSMVRKRRRMNPANSRALRRSLRRLRAFDNLSHRVTTQLKSCAPARRKRKC